MSLKSFRDLCYSWQITEQDYIVEYEIQRLTEKIDKFIKINRELNERIVELDRNIGLLIRNSRIIVSREQLQHMRTQHHLCKNRTTDQLVVDLLKNSRSTCSRLEAYQHLFYALQTQPIYLARLLCTDLSFTSSSFIKNCIYSLFNHEATQRDTLLLCRCLGRALFLELDALGRRPMPGVESDDPLIISMSLDLSRNHRTLLYDTLKSVIIDILARRERTLCVDPVAIYKYCYPERDGRSMTVTVEEALGDRRVHDILTANIPSIIDYATRLLNIMVTESFIQFIPLRVRYLCHVWKQILIDKYNDLSHHETTHLISNMIFVRLIRPCILFSDSYSSMTCEIGSKPLLNSRLNLSDVCKLLHAVASGTKHLSFSSALCSSLDRRELDMVDKFFEWAWSMFAQFTDTVINVDEIDDFSMIEEYACEARIEPPQVRMTLQEIVELHKLVYKYSDDIAPDKSDPIYAEFHQLLFDFGSPPDEIYQLLISDLSQIDVNTSIDELNMTEITLSLRRRNFPDVQLVTCMMIRVKQAILELIKARPECDDLNEVLFQKVEKNERNDYVELKQNMHWYLNNDLKKNSVIFSPTGSSLIKLRDFAVATMRHTQAKNFNEILAMLTDDIVEKLQFHQQRNTQLVRLEHTLNQLFYKKDHLQEIHQCYEKYLIACKANYKLSAKYEPREDRRLSALRYSAFRLKEKGVLLSLGDFKPSQFKRVYFELTPSCESGLTIDVKISQRSVEMDRVKLDLQQLLRLHSDGVKIINPVGKAQLNIHQLLYLINFKFYFRKCR